MDFLALLVQRRGQGARAARQHEFFPSVYCCAAHARWPSLSRLELPGEPSCVVEHKAITSIDPEYFGVLCG